MNNQCQPLIAFSFKKIIKTDCKNWVKGQRWLIQAQVHRTYANKSDLMYWLNDGIEIRISGLFTDRKFIKFPVSRVCLLFPTFFSFWGNYGNVQLTKRALLEANL